MKLILLIVSYLIYSADALRFNLKPNTQKCLRDELQAHQLIVGEYEVINYPGQQVDYEVRIYFYLTKLVLRELVIPIISIPSSNSTSLSKEKFWWPVGYWFSLSTSSLITNNSSISFRCEIPNKVYCPKKKIFHVENSHSHQKFLTHTNCASSLKFRRVSPSWYKCFSSDWLI